MRRALQEFAGRQLPDAAANRVDDPALGGGQVIRSQALANQPCDDLTVPYAMAYRMEPAVRDGEADAVEMRRQADRRP